MDDYSRGDLERRARRAFSRRAWLGRDAEACSSSRSSSMASVSLPGFGFRGSRTPAPCAPPATTPSTLPRRPSLVRGDVFDLALPSRPALQLGTQDYACRVPRSAKLRALCMRCGRVGRVDADDRARPGHRRGASGGEWASAMSPAIRARGIEVLEGTRMPGAWWKRVNAWSTAWAVRVGAQLSGMIKGRESDRRALAAIVPT